MRQYLGSLVAVGVGLAALTLSSCTNLDLRENSSEKHIVKTDYAESGGYLRELAGLGGLVLTVGGTYVLNGKIEEKIFGNHI